MRILLDACVPRGLRRSLVGHDVLTAREMGWNQLPDAELLQTIGHAFDVLLTVDKSLPLQQKAKGSPFAIVLMRAKTNRLVDLLPLVPALLRTLEKIAPGEVRQITG